MTIQAATRNALDKMLASPEAVKRVVDACATSKCPNGHVLPNRYAHGRCSPVLCVAGEVTQADREAQARDYTRSLELTPVGLEGSAHRPTTAEESEVTKAQNDAAIALARARARHDALIAMQPGLTHLPATKLPPADAAPEASRDHMDRRLSALAPLMLELEAAEALYGGDGAARASARRNILAMHTRQMEKPEVNRAVIVILAKGDPYKRSATQEVNAYARRIEEPRSEAGRLQAGAAGQAASEEGED